MLYLIKACFIKNAKKITCNDGIENPQGVTECNLTTRSNIPYFHIMLQDIVDGIVVKEGYEIIWSTTRDGNILFQSMAPSTLKYLLHNGQIKFHLVCTLHQYPCESFHDSHMLKGEDYIYMVTEKFYNPGIREQSFGELITRLVKSYRDSSGTIQQTYTCFVFANKCKTEEDITKVFSYYGYTVKAKTPTLVPYLRLV